ncbi:MAG: hypothetical protein ACOZAN_02465 [Patescibacteria group bacterium]
MPKIRFLVIVAIVSSLFAWQISSRRDQSQRNEQEKIKYETSITDEISRDDFGLQKGHSPTAQPLPSHQLQEGEHFFAEVGMYLTIPKDLSYRSELEPTESTKILRSFYIESKDYQTHVIIYRANQADLEKVAQEISPGSLQSMLVNEQPAIGGITDGPKLRYLVAFLKNGVLVTLATHPPTEQNILRTEQIISTVIFEKN